MMRRILATCAAALLAAPAFAGGLAPAPEPVEIVPVIPAPQPSADWSGFYAGLRAGTADFEATSGGSTSSRTLPTDGSFYGGFAGYRHDFGRIVIGGELRYSDASGVDNPQFDGIENESLTTVMLQAGYDMGRVLPFVGIGGARLASTVFGSSMSDNGIAYGIGVDFMVSQRFMLGVDANRFEFDDFGGTGFDVSGNSVALRAAFKF